MFPIRSLKDKHAGETCVVIGNGPSLRDVDLERLAKKYPTFGSNRIYLFPFVPKYYAICDELMAINCLVDIQKPEFNPEIMFLSRTIPMNRDNYIPVNYTVSGQFSKDIDHEIVIGGTVTYVLLQIAYYMGFSKVLLVGVDHNYPGAGAKGRPGSRFIQDGEDQDHFDPNYFIPGAVFNRPELKGTETSYQLAKLIYEKDGRKIINVTTNTSLLVYDRDSINKYY